MCFSSIWRLINYGNPHDVSRRQALGIALSLAGMLVIVTRGELAALLVLRFSRLDGVVTGPALWENGFKDTVIAIRARLPAFGHSSTPQASSSGTATSSSTRTTR